MNRALALACAWCVFLLLGPANIATAARKAKPTPPTSPSPASGAVNVSTSPTLAWTSNFATRYDVHFGTISPPPALSTGQTSASYTPASPLANGTTYYWQIVAFNNDGSTPGPIWSFTTAPPPPPGVSNSPTPADGATDVSRSVTLTWRGSGATSYDVRMGTSNPPTVVATGLTSASYSPTPLLAGTTYYWQIVASNSGGSTPGPIWSFTTAPPPPDAPGTPLPADGATDVSRSVGLTWSGTATSYEVRMGTSNPPTVVATGLTSASYSPAGLRAGTTYYWQIVASNGAGATPGPIWSFSTAGAVWMVYAGGNFQAALNGAQPGDTILLEAGATFTGNYVLPAKSSDATRYITIRSSADDATLPLSGVRIDPTYASRLPKLKSPNNMPALATAAYAHHYKIQFLEFLANAQGAGDIFVLGDGTAAQNTLSRVPYELIVDRVYIHGDVTLGQKRGIGLHSASTTIQNSYIAEIKSTSQDSQAICGWNGPGPYTITNNYLEASGENVMFGGADPAIPELVPSDITVVGNHLAKPLSWKTQKWVVKNLFELKNAQRVVVDGNVMENNWLAGQPGYAILFTPRNQNGTAPWTVVQHVSFTNNVVRHVSSAVNILGRDNLAPSQLTNDITIRNNLFVDVSGATYGGVGRLLLINGGSNITVDHNTVFNDGASTVYAYNGAVQNFVFTNNIMPDNQYGIMGDGKSPGNSTIAAYFPNSLFLANIIVAAPVSTFPSGNYYPAAMSDVGFVDYTGGNYRLAATSKYKNRATDGSDPGCNVDAVNAAAGTSY